MRYTEYFGQMVKNFGAPKLNTEQFQRMMNIIHLEGLICGHNNSKNNIVDYDFRYRQSKSLNELTGRRSPSVLYNELIKMSNL